MGPPLYVSIGAATADNGAAVTAVASTSLAATGAGAGAATWAALVNVSPVEDSRDAGGPLASK
jgi:hypothetical protein